MNLLPPPRDLPPVTRARIRYRVERLDSARGPSPVLVTAGITTAALVAVALVVLPRGPVGPTDVSAADAPEVSAEIERECARASVRGADEPPRLTLRNRVRDEIGVLYLLYSDSEVVTCSVDAVSGEYDAFAISIDEQSSPIAVDAAPALFRGNEPGDRPAMIAGGRVDDQRVSKVEVRFGDVAVPAPVVAGTFLVRFVPPTGWSMQAVRLRSVAVVVYDQDGAVVGSGVR